jgi:hypothetical protein
MLSVDFCSGLNGLGQGRSSLAGQDQRQAVFHPPDAAALKKKKGPLPRSGPFPYPARAPKPFAYAM